MTNPPTPLAPPTTLADLAALDKTTPGLLISYDSPASATLGTDVWRVAGPVVMQFADHRWLYVPAGYLTDGASVPRLLWDLIPPWGEYGNAAIGHDILCEYLTVWDRRGGDQGECAPVRITRAQADSYLREMMRATGVNAWRRWAIYAAVRAYAFFAKPTSPRARYDKRLLEDNWRTTMEVRRTGVAKLNQGLTAFS